ncbi:MAG: hypothetical protein NTV80_05620 [Verrucomicrobia bacterium]|nr:hypothetical protein [Verrucomicrobiota bacterium]
MLSATASGHGNEFISARLELLDGGSLIQLKITAEYGSNPMIPDRAMASRAVQDVLRLVHHGQARSLADLAPLTIEQTTEAEGTLPTSITHADDGLDHQFMIACWRWVPDTSEISFSVPNGSLHDVLLWRQLPDAQTQSILLLGGDSSKPISVKPPQAHVRLLVIGLVGALFVYGFHRITAGKLVRSAGVK